MSGQGGPGGESGGAGGDPSMEDILASIRRILSEDEAAPAAAEPHAAPPRPAPLAPERGPDAPPDASSDVLALDASMLVEEPQSGDVLLPMPMPMPGGPERLPALHADRSIGRATDAGQAAITPAPTEPAIAAQPEDRIDMPEPPASAPPASAPPASAPSAGQGGSPANPGPLVAPEAAAAAASSVGSLLRTIGNRQGVAVRGGGPTIEDLVREELRPALKAWLDANLPPLVERLVRAEIERVVGRADV